MMNKTREEFIVFIRQAIHDPGSAAYTELYNFLIDCFMRADKNMDGAVEVYSNVTFHSGTLFYFKILSRCRSLIA